MDITPDKVASDFEAEIAKFKAQISGSEQWETIALRSFKTGYRTGFTNGYDNGVAITKKRFIDLSESELGE